MEDAYVVVYLGVALVSLLVVLAGRRRWGARGDGAADGLRLPPGPWQLPVIGSLHHLALAGQLPHRAMRDLARRHGPAMLLRLGEVPTLVVSSRKGAREVMRTHDTAFATRPLSATMRVLTNGGRDIIFAPYGDYWRQLRKICGLRRGSPRGSAAPCAALGSAATPCTASSTASSRSTWRGWAAAEATTRTCSTCC